VANIQLETGTDALLACHTVSRKTIHDVAKAAGVAIKTVSRVLNDEAQCQTRDARAGVGSRRTVCNIQPSLSARSLAAGAPILIGLVYENPSANYLSTCSTVPWPAAARRSSACFVHQCSGRGDDLSRCHGVDRPDARWTA